MSGLISVDGNIQAAENAVIPALDRGLLFGDSVFEVIVAFQNHIIDGQQHLDRLHRSAEQYGITIPWTHAELLFEVSALLEKTNYPKANIRIVVTRGSGLGLAAHSEMKPRRIIYCMPAKELPNETYTRGLRFKMKALNFTERGANAKLGNYIRSIHALHELEREEYDDVIWYNADSEITEASTANVFLIGRHGDMVEIATPPANSGLLLGITRWRIIELLQMAKIPVTERIITTDELARFDEGFVCSTVRGLVPIQKIDKHRLHSARPQSVFRQIERLFNSWIASETGLRMDWNSGRILERLQQLSKDELN